MLRSIEILIACSTLVACGAVHEPPPDTREAGGGTITHGPLVGAVRANEARIWLRTSQAARVEIEHATSASFEDKRTAGPTTTAEADDFTTQVQLNALPAEGTRHYRVKVDGVLQPGSWQFDTGPTGTAGTYELAFLTDVGRAAAPIWDAIASELPDQLVAFGDLDHTNPGRPRRGSFVGCIPDDPSLCREVLDQMRDMHKYLRDDRTPFGQDLKRVMIDRRGRQIPFIRMWDDHDYGENNSDRLFDWRDEALKAFREYFVMASRDDAPPGQGTWQLQSHGPADIFVLDLRSERDTSDYPNEEFPACPSPKSMLGTTQKSWLEAGLSNSTRTWKIVVSSVPFNPACKPYDAWGSFLCERQEILDYIEDHGITGVVFVSGDIHSGGLIDNGSNSGRPEISVPHANLECFYDTWVRRGASCHDPEHPNLCGTWSEGFRCGRSADCVNRVPPSGSQAYPGYALLTVSPSLLQLEVRGLENERRDCLQIPSSTFVPRACP